MANQKQLKCYLKYGLNIKDKVKVGSGWSQEQRLQYMDGSIVGKIITVQYFEETKNDKGGISLRFPNSKKLFTEKKREV